MLGDSVIPLPHIYGARIKGVEVFCPLDPPPPYEAVAGSSTNVATQVQSKLAYSAVQPKHHGGWIFKVATNIFDFFLA